MIKLEEILYNHIQILLGNSCRFFNARERE